MRQARLVLQKKPAKQGAKTRQATKQNTDCNHPAKLVMQLTVYLRIVSAIDAIPNKKNNYKWHVSPLFIPLAGSAIKYDSLSSLLPAPPLKTDCSHPSYQLMPARKVFVKKCWQAAFFYSSQLWYTSCTSSSISSISRMRFIFLMSSSDVSST